ncbi:MAG: hypothetical protein Unbinned400contig1002_4 [Prokaryotic dsDNA virus sp.]|nr:MAG: hypothetical protein Unbinned400contig1002_4 [Prokaryotic dsDNA virus sp.]|tara:strand:+ start:1357 stop:1545 length:189 start_codon:yes stop_codon:yes gene_type:complete
MTKEQKLELCDALLDDDEGVCEAGWNALVKFGLVPECVQGEVSVQTGRYYLEPREAGTTLEE